MTERISQSQAVGKRSDKLDRLEGKLLELRELVEGAVASWMPLHEMERATWRLVIEVGLEVLEAYVEKLGDGDLGRTLELEDGSTLRRLPQPRERRLRTIFGTLTLRRAAYGSREGQRLECVPLDQRLGLPAGEYSYTLQQWTQALAVECSYARTRELLRELLDLDVPVDSLERINRSMASPVVDFLDQQPPATPAPRQELVVASADTKGVPMRAAPGTAGPAEKKMAVLGTVYSVAPRPRTPEEVTAALFRDPSSPVRRFRPPLRDKRLRASLERDADGKMSPAFAEIFVWMADEVRQRSATPRRPVVLMDGQRDLWQAQEETFAELDPIPVLDLLHVTPRLWNAADILCAKAQREPFVRERVLRILRGEVRAVVKGLRRLASTRPLTSKQRRDLRRIANYFDHNAERMRYGEYLADGLPIATGVIEGACRHLVRDRLERAGMRWTLPGAQAMLDLRSVRLSASWSAFCSFHIDCETPQQHPHRSQLQLIDWPIQQAA